MASQSLYRKWRSQTFSDLVGQEPVVRTLKNALKAGNLAHAYLFTGPRGTGKTSTARLLAKTINCLHPKDSEPCNECQQCREITAGNSFNVIEIDAASNRGIDSIRELREKVMVPPSTGKYKVYILDEAHMLTVEAFNALLKTLEEPPAHAVFVMATTDVHKMLPTVLSRCQRFDFKRITTRQIVAHLNFVAEQEHVSLEPGAAALIARAAAGGMRDALSLLDQAIAYSGQQITLGQVQAMLGIADPRAIQKFLLHIAQLNSPGGLHLIHELVESGADLRQINTQVAEYWRAMMLIKAGANVGEIVDSTEDELAEISEVAGYFSLEELIECARVFAQNELIQKNQGTPQLGLELAFLTCLELHRRAQGGQSVAAVPAVTPAATIPTATKQSAIPTQTTPSRPSLPEAPRIVSVSQVQPTELSRLPDVPAAPPVPVPSVKVSEETSGAFPDWDELVTYPDEGEEAGMLAEHRPESSHNTLVEVSAEASPAPSEESAPSISLTVEQIKEKWEYVKRRVRTKKDGHKIAALLNGYSVVDIESTAGLPIVVIQAGAAFYYNAIQKGAHHGTIEWALKIELGQECKLRLLPPEAAVSAAPVPPPLIQNSGSSAAMTLAPQQSAHLERPPKLTGNSQRKKQDPPVALAPTQSQDHSAGQPLAGTPKVRENSSIQAKGNAKPGGESRREAIEKKVKSDPVVQEVARMFKAEIKEIHLK